MVVKKLSVLLIIPYLDGADVGESFVAYKWATEIAKHCDVTILTQRRKGHIKPSEQLPNLNVVEWKMLELPSFLERINAMIKPGYPVFYWRVRNWIKRGLQSGKNFDIIHQITPLSMRFSCPAIGFGVPVIMGPVNGSLNAPDAFKKECKTGKWYTKFRILDAYRFKYDLRLKNTYNKVDLLIGAAPYVEKLLAPIELKLFKVMAEVGLDEVSQRTLKPSKAGENLRLLHIGRGVRTKGLRDIVTAMQYLKDRPWITLTSAGKGEEIEVCRRLAQKLGVEKNISFLEHISRERCDELYHQSDIFTFPSFREPTGGVLIEAMGHSLPILSVNYGGPASLVDKTAGILLPLSTPEQLALDLAEKIKMLDDDREHLHELAIGAGRRMEEVALWPKKMEWLMQLYKDIGCIEDNT